MSRKAIPLEQRLLEAKVRTRHIRKAANAPQVDIKIIEEVPDLSPEAKKYWPRFKALLKALPVTAESDVMTVQRMVETYAEVRQYMKVIKEEGPFYRSETKFGSVIRPHPAVSALSDADRRLHSYLIDFGLTPAARSKVQGDGHGNTPKDPLSQFGV